MNTQFILPALAVVAITAPLMAQPTPPPQQESTLQTLLNAGKDYSAHRAREKRIERYDERRNRHHHPRRNEHPRRHRR